MNITEDNNMSERIQQLKTELRNGAGYIEFHINDLIESGFLPSDFLHDITMDACLYLKDMDEMKPRLNLLRADFRTTAVPNKIKDLVFKNGINVEELDTNGIDETYNSEEMHWKYSINHTFKYYNGLHEVLTQEILNLPKIEISQMWWFDSFPAEVEYATQIKKLYDVLTKVFYPEYTNVEYGIQQTFYNKGCGIEDHEDGVTENSLFAALTYLNNRYDSSWGGRLRVGTKSDIKLIEPKFGVISMLDFTLKNPTHGVETVTNNNGRYAILSFVNKK